MARMVTGIQLHYDTDVDQNHHASHNPEQSRKQGWDNSKPRNQWLVGATLDFTSAVAKATVTRYVYLQLPSVSLLQEDFARGPIHQISKDSVTLKSFINMPTTSCSTVNNTLDPQHKSYTLISIIPRCLLPDLNVERLNHDPPI